MKTNCLSEPSVDTAAEFVREALEFNNLLTIAGECAVDYEGRASSFFSYSDCHVTIKPDGTFLIHQRDGRKPTNWQPPGCTFTVGVEDGELIIVGRRDKQNERVEVHCPEIYHVTSYDISEPTEKEIFGTEDQMQTRIMKEPEVLEEGFRPVESERSISVGAIDIFGYDTDERPVIVELKRRRASPSHVDQLKRYMNSYGDEIDGEARGILVAPSFTDTAKEYLSEEGLEHIVLEPQLDKADSFTTTLGDFE